MLVITNERRKRNMSQAELARRAGINQTSLSRIESGKEPAFPKRGQRIAEALGWTDAPEKLFEEIEVNDAVR